jgi:hypothetical protein
LLFDVDDFDDAFFFEAEVFAELAGAGVEGFD